MPERHLLSSFTLDSGVTLTEVPVAYQTWGALNEARDNAIVVCHALTGNTDVADWWGPLLGPGRAFDTDRYFVVCANVLGSPYGSAAPVTTNPATGERYGIDFPEVTIRDTVRLHRQLLDHLGVRQVALAVGGSMGGMQVLEWGFYGSYVRTLAPVAVGGWHSAWCIGWSEAQRQAVYADPRWQDGRYAPGDPPAAGLAAARMMAMVSYRSAPSFEARFGREPAPRGENGQPAPPFSVQSYLRYQGAKLVERFDAACYVRLTEQMDTHDLGRGRGSYAAAVQQLHQPTLVIGIDSDVLYPLAEQQALAEALPQSTLATVASPAGHDAFLIELDQLTEHLTPWMEMHLSDVAAPAAPVSCEGSA